MIEVYGKNFIVDEVGEGDGQDVSVGVGEGTGQGTSEGACDTSLGKDTMIENESGLDYDDLVHGDDYTGIEGDEFMVDDHDDGGQTY